MAVTTKVEFKDSNLITNRIFDDDVGRFVAETCANQFKPYVPMESGTLSQHVTTEPFKITYESIYARYQWDGVSKSGRPLNYSKEQHRLARSHWEQSAYRNRRSVIISALQDYIEHR